MNLQPLCVYLPPSPRECKLTNDNLLILGEPIRRHLQIQWRRPFPHSAGDVVVASVAGAEPAAKVAGFSNGDAAQMRADAFVMR